MFCYLTAQSFYRCSVVIMSREEADDDDDEGLRPNQDVVEVA